MALVRLRWTSAFAPANVGFPQDRATAEGRYVKLYIAAPMYRSQLCIGRMGRIRLTQAQHGCWRGAPTIFFT